MAPALPRTGPVRRGVVDIGHGARCSAARQRTGRGLRGPAQQPHYNPPSSLRVSESYILTTSDFLDNCTFSGPRLQTNVCGQSDPAVQLFPLPMLKSTTLPRVQHLTIEQHRNPGICGAGTVDLGPYYSFLWTQGLQISSRWPTSDW